MNRKVRVVRFTSCDCRTDECDGWRVCVCVAVCMCALEVAITNVMTIVCCSRPSVATATVRPCFGRKDVRDEKDAVYVYFGLVGRAEQRQERGIVSTLLHTRIRSVGAPLTFYLTHVTTRVYAVWISAVHKLQAGIM